MKRLAWFLVAELAFANFVNAMVLALRWLIACRAYEGYDPEPALAVLGGSEDY